MERGMGRWEWGNWRIARRKRRGGGKEEGDEGEEGGVACRRAITRTLTVRIAIGRRRR